MRQRLLRPFSLPARNPALRLLVTAGFCSGIGTWIAIVALNVDILDRTHSGAWLAVLNIATVVPAAFFGLLGGPLVDRLSRKALMVGSDLVRLAVFAALPFVDTAGAIVLLALVAGIGDAFFRPALLAGLPNVVDDEELPAANYVMQTVQWLTTGIGPLLGGVLVAASGPDLAYWANAASFAVSALLLARISGTLLQSARPLSRGHLNDLLEGFAVVRRSRALVVVLLVWTLAMAASGGINVSEVVLAKETLDGGAFGYGLMWAASGIGLVVGGLAFTLLVARRPVAWLYPRALLLFGVAIGGAAAAPDVWVAAAAMLVGGLANGMAVGANVTLVQRGAPDAVRGRAFTVIMAVNYAMLAVAMVVAGELLHAVGARWLFAGCAVVLAAAGVLAAVLGRPLVSAERRPAPLAGTTAG